MATLVDSKARRSRLGAWVCLALGAWGCSSHTSGGTEAPPCNRLVDDAVTVILGAVPTVAPPPTGGNIAEGTYELSLVTLYTGPGGTSVPPIGAFSAVIQITGSTMQQAGVFNDVEKRSTTSFTISGTTMSAVDTCPAADSATHSFSATSTDLRLYDTRALGTYEQAYLLRQSQ